MKKFIRFVVFIIIIIAVYFTTVYLLNQNELYIKTVKEQNEIVNKQDSDDSAYEKEENVDENLDENNSGEVINTDKPSGEMDVYTESGEEYETEDDSGDMTEEVSGEYNLLVDDMHKNQNSGEEYFNNNED